MAFAMNSRASEIAARASRFDAEVEQFLDEQIIGDIHSAADAEEREAALRQRREQRAARARISERAAELLQAELTRERHETELHQLQEAVASNRDARPPTPAGSGARAAGAAAGRVAKPYVADLTNFVSEAEAASSARALREENELLRRCLSGTAAKPDAFQSYLNALERGRGEATPAAPPDRPQ
mmetsp:Transcript_10214/g.33840  ORF Transcript_10214/g.33840 Transcript_10214/m.33840 type:complete len:185 (-) Transcript_10214:179-733(-)